MKKQLITLAIAFCIITAVLSSTLTLYASPSSTITLSSGIYPQATYTIYKEGSVYYAKSAYGSIDYSGTDFSSVMQQVINSITHGGTIYITEGDYTPTNTIYINFSYSLFGLTIKGSGWNTVITIPNSFNKPLFYVASDYVEIADLRIDGNKAGQSVSASCIELYDTYRCYIHRVMIYGWYGIGIYLHGTSGKYAIQNLVEDCYMEDLGGSTSDACVKLGDYATDTHVKGNDLQHDNGMGIIVFAGASIIEGNTIWGSRSGIEVYGTSSAHTMIIGNRIDYHNYYGISLEAGANNVLISGNEIYFNSQSSSNAYDGISIASCTHIAVISNMLGSTYSGGGGEKQRYGVAESGTSDYNIIKCNKYGSNISGNYSIIGSHTVVG